MHEDEVLNDAADFARNYWSPDSMEPPHWLGIEGEIAIDVECGPSIMFEMGTLDADGYVDGYQFRFSVPVDLYRDLSSAELADRIRRVPDGYSFSEEWLERNDPGLRDLRALAAGEVDHEID